MREYAALVLAAVMLGQNVASSFTVNIPAKMSSTVLFHLPPLAKCAPYRLLDNKNQPVVTIGENGENTISEWYNFRASVERINQSTVLLLNHVTPTDNGAFSLEQISSRKLPENQECVGYYFLSVASQQGYWLEWGPWSTCSSTCDSGSRLRQRDCTTDNACFTGNARQHETCLLGVPCITSVWHEWYPWSECTVTCGSGSRYRRRYCLDSNQQVSRGCRGNHTEYEVCNSAQCPTIQVSDGKPADNDKLPSPTISSYDTMSKKEGGGGPMQNDPGASASVTHFPETITVPLSAIVGATAGIFMLILLVVIVILLVRLKKRKAQGHGAVERGHPHRHKRSLSSIRISDTRISSHTYAEIPDDANEPIGKLQERQSSISTIDNNYVGLPSRNGGKSRKTSPGDTYLNIPSGPFCDVRGSEKCVYYNRPNVNARSYPEDNSSYAVPLTSLR